MANLTPVDFDPFGQSDSPAPSLTPVDHDPFADEGMDPAHKQARAYLEAHPEYKNKGLFDYAQRAAQGATLGWADNAVAGLAALRDTVKHGGSLRENYNLEQAMQDEQLKDARKNTGLTGSALEFAGGMLPISRIGNVASALTTPLKASALTGAAAGGIEASGDGENPLVGAALGGVTGGAAHGLISGVSKLAGLANKKPNVPSLDDLKATADNARNAVNNSGVMYADQGVQDLNTKLRTILNDQGYLKAPEKFKELKGTGFESLLNRITGKNATIPTHVTRDPTDLRDLQQVLTEATLKAPGTDSSRVAQLLKREVDTFKENASGSQVARGNAALAASQEKLANRSYQKYYKDLAVQDAIKEAEYRAAKTGSGGNLENTLRQEVDKLRNARSDWSPEELAAIENVNANTPGRRLVRTVGKLSPEGNGLNAMLHLMAAPTVVGGVTIPAAITGFGAKRLSEYQTRKAIENLSRIIRAGGALNAFPAPNAVQRGLGKSQRKIVEGLLSGGATFR